MTAALTPQIYLATPRSFAVQDFAKTLAKLLDGFAIACVRLALDTPDEDEILRTAEHLRELCHTRDVPIVIETHYRLVARLGLDGVHLVNSTKSVRDARKSVGADQIVGTFCGSSRHAGSTAAEIGCDYVAFGPCSTPGLLGDGKRAEADLFQWWSDMIEVPVVAEGGITPDIAEELAPLVDFLCLSDEVWTHPDGPQAALKTIQTRLR